MPNIIDSIQLSGVTYGIKGSGGTQTIELTQAQYDALAVKDPNTFYIITDATAVDLTNYYTKTEVDTALSEKQATLVSGTNIKTINNESILGSGNIDIQGGSSYTGVSGVTINNNNEIYYDGIYKTWLTSNHSNDYAVYWFRGRNAKIWISDTAPTSSNMYWLRSQFSFGGVNNLGSSNGAVAFGQYINIRGFYASSFGQGNYSNNQVEFSVGQYNTSSTASTTFGDSGNTLFSVGNGTTDNARHNAFEIRQNGDIYLTLDGQDVKLQDKLGGSSITVDTALDSGSTNPVENRVIYNKIDEVEQVTAAALNNINDRLSEDEEVTAAGLNAVNSALGGLKLQQITQAAYDALVQAGTTDPSTLYIITE